MRTMRTAIIALVSALWALSTIPALGAGTDRLPRAEVLPYRDVSRKLTTIIRASTGTGDRLGVLLTGLAFLMLDSRPDKLRGGPSSKGTLDGRDLSLM
jgi:hypothetical protein